MVLLEGFVLGLAYAAPIGSQNVYVIQAAVRNPLRISARVALLVTVADISLAMGCLYGVGKLLQWSSWLKMALTIVGSLFLLYLGARLILSRDVRTANRLETEASRSYRWRRIAASAFVLTWLNPQALIDGTLLLGGFRAHLAAHEVPWFAVGMAIASTLWFHTLTGIIAAIRTRFNPVVMKFINRGCGLMLCAFAIRLAITLV
jgi:L-lysine exporter family protein LysE/ArgO